MKLYHVTYDNHGPEVMFFPRSPENRAPNEPAAPKRVCVSPRIGDCLRLTGWKDGSHKMHCYEIEIRHVPKISWALPKKYVPDYKKYGREEVWLLKAQAYTLSYIGYIRMFRMEMLTSSQFWYFKRGGASYDTVDPTQLLDPAVHVKHEASRHVEMRQWMRSMKVVGLSDSKPRLAKYADDVRAKQQITEGKVPYRVPLKKVSRG